MAKKSQSSASKGKGGKQLWVVSERKGRQRFLRGVITHFLSDRGLDFDQAYSLAQTVKDEFSRRGEVSTDEIRQFLRARLAKTYGIEAADAYMRPTKPPIPGLTVIYHGQRLPFSRGLLARSILAAGVDIDSAYRLVTRLETELRQDDIRTLTSDEIGERVGKLLDREESKGVARRYRLVRRIRHLPKPLVIYIGGASGTGKSTLALELAPLLRIYRVTATDTIRQVMRMLFSPQILPAIHTSSFETFEPSFGTLPHETLFEGEVDPDQRIASAFLEQSIRVGVGVRGVVERAIAENRSMLVEGVHLVPPLVPFPELEGACYQVPIMLGTSDLEAHRARFLGRANRGDRGADRYVEGFRSIRTVHDFVLDQSESDDIPFIDTSTPGSVSRALRQVAKSLEATLDRLEPPGERARSIPPILLLIIDGLADRPVRALGGRTPLQAAETPTLDRLARDGQCGLADPIEPGVVPDTAAGSLALFGQSPRALARGPVEALGAGYRPDPGDIALRGNFATLDDKGQVVDRRAGRIRDHAPELAEALDRLPLPGLEEEVEVRVLAATEHRLAIVLRAATNATELGSEIRGSDPGDGAIPCLPLEPVADDPRDEASVLCARALAAFEAEARHVLAHHPINRERIEKGLPPANTVLTRGPGRIHQSMPIEGPEGPLDIACIAGDRTLLGLATWLGADPIYLPQMTANLDTDLDLKFDQALEALGQRDMVVLHLKGADIAAHDTQPTKKAEFISRIDGHLERLLESVKGPLRVVVGGDHATLSESGQHAADPVPVLIWGDGIEADEIVAYDEISVAQGKLGRFPLQRLLARASMPS